jgi:ABC-type transport system substrate-binding protein
MIASIGKPMLPTKIVSVLIPPNGEVGDISLLSCEASMMKLGRKILPGQYPVVNEACGSTFVEPDSTVYESEKEYPGALFENAGIQWFQGYKIQSIKIFPVQYSPKNGEIAYYRTMSFALRVDSAGSSPLRNTFQSGKALASEIVVNPDKIDVWIAPSAMASMNPTIDYVIITDAAFQSDFQALADWKAAKGLTAQVYNTTWIYDNYEGVDNQEKIRNFISAMYNDCGTQYALLGGDYNIVPPRYIYMEDCLWPEEAGGGLGPQYKPTDYYYACLDGNWDTNNNGRFLEQLDLNGSGYPMTCVEPIPDFYPEVYVGRLPAATEAEARLMVNKTINYERSPPLGDWRNKALLLGAIANYQNEGGTGDPKTDMAAWQEWVKAAYLDPNGINTTTMYEKQGLDPSNKTCTCWLNQTNVQSSWSAGCWIVSTSGHGDPQRNYRKIWASDINGNGIPDSDEMLWPLFIDSTSMTLTNGEKLPQAYIDGCSCGKFDDMFSDCIPEWLLKSSTGGAVAAIAASRTSYYALPTEQGYCQELQRLYWQEFFNPASGYRPGIALYWSKVGYWQEGFDMTHCAHKKECLIYNLMGDPDLQLGVHTLEALPNSDAGVLENGTLDIGGWPLDAGSINALIGNPNVTLDEYAPFGMMEVDMNNQMWPTGDPTSKFYTPTSIRSSLSLAFRQAVACLIDRDSIVRDVLNGYGYRMDVPVPPSQSQFQYIDMNNYTASGLIYNFNRTRAAAILDGAGFTMLQCGFRQDPLTPGVALKPLIFYIRQDDPFRLKAGQMLTTELRNIGIPVKAIIADRWCCIHNVMDLYDYNLYTGGWAFDTIPTQYADLYSSESYLGPSVGSRSPNYVGFCNHDFDAWALKVRYPANMSDAEAAAKTAGYLFLKYCPSVPLYCLRLVEAYKTGWTGVVNMAGYGIDNYWSFLAMSNPNDITIDLGLKGVFGSGSDFNVIAQGGMGVSGLMYEGMLGYDPFNLAPTELFIANATSVGSWDATGVGGDSDATYVNFTIRDNVFWHNATGQPRRALDIYDVNFTFYYVKACGTGVADFDHVVLYPSENKIGIYYGKRSIWALQWAGCLPIINRDIWSHVAPANAQSFDPTVSDVNGDGVPDIYEDGTGAWQLTSYSSAAASLTEDRRYYLSRTFISNRLAEMFHYDAGDINENSVVNAQDMGFMVRAMFTNNVTSPKTPLRGWGVWNPDCDLNYDGVVNVLDLALVATNYGKTMG